MIGEPEGCRLISHGCGWFASAGPAKPHKAAPASKLLPRSQENACFTLLSFAPPTRHPIGGRGEIHRRRQSPRVSFESLQTETISRFSLQRTMLRDDAANRALIGHFSGTKPWIFTKGWFGAGCATSDSASGRAVWSP
ncbi:hypothetical protein [Bauldia litoralis]|uniref:hypothetical protein n=1 Tax=Bauldia litoralis TaxID=665467 RepID=UPI0032631213